MPRLLKNLLRGPSVRLSSRRNLGPMGGYRLGPNRLPAAPLHWPIASLQVAGGKRMDLPVPFLTAEEHPETRSPSITDFRGVVRPFDYAPLRVAVRAKSRYRSGSKALQRPQGASCGIRLTHHPQTAGMDAKGVPYFPIYVGRLSIADDFGLASKTRSKRKCACRSGRVF